MIADWLRAILWHHQPGVFRVTFCSSFEREVEGLGSWIAYAIATENGARWL